MSNMHIPKYNKLIYNYWLLLLAKTKVLCLEMAKCNKFKSL